MSLIARLPFSQSLYVNTSRALKTFFSHSSQALSASPIFRHPFRDGEKWDVDYSRAVLDFISKSNERHPENAPLTAFILGQYRNRTMSMPPSVYLMQQAARTGRVAIVSIPEGRMLRECLETASKQHSGQSIRDAVVMVHGSPDGHLMCGNNGESSDLSYEDLKKEDFERVSPDGNIALLCCCQPREAIDTWSEKSARVVLAAPDIPIRPLDTIYVDGELSSYHLVTQEPILTKFSADGTQELIAPPEERKVRAFQVRDFHRCRQDAIEGSMDAQYELAKMYENGVGTPQSFSNALEWYRRAASRGHLTALEKARYPSKWMPA